MVISSIIASTHDDQGLKSVENYLYGKDGKGKGLPNEIEDIQTLALRPGKGCYSYTLEEKM
jgi:hypothetical protein